MITMTTKNCMLSVFEFVIVRHLFMPFIVLRFFSKQNIIINTHKFIVHTLRDNNRNNQIDYW